MLYVFFISFSYLFSLLFHSNNQRFMSITKTSDFKSNAYFVMRFSNVSIYLKGVSSLHNPCCFVSVQNGVQLHVSDSFIQLIRLILVHLGIKFLSIRQKECIHAVLRSWVSQYSIADLDSLFADFSV